MLFCLTSAWIAGSVACFRGGPFVPRCPTLLLAAACRTNLVQLLMDGAGQMLMHTCTTHMKRKGGGA